MRDTRRQLLGAGFEDPFDASVMRIRVAQKQGSLSGSNELVDDLEGLMAHIGDVLVRDREGFIPVWIETVGPHGFAPQRASTDVDRMLVERYGHARHAPTGGSDA